jgi:hypothetical protein
MAKTLIVLYLSGLLFTLPGCSSHSARKTVVLDYGDFGPQALAWELIGFEWYQWDPCGYEDPNFEYNIRIVIYDDATDDEIRKLYPTVEHKIDYRYVRRAEATKFLKQAIAEWDEASRQDPCCGLPDEVRQRLKSTLRRIEVSY